MIYMTISMMAYDFLVTLEHWLAGIRARCGGIFDEFRPDFIFQTRLQTMDCFLIADQSQLLAFHSVFSTIVPRLE